MKHHLRSRYRLWKRRTRRFVIHSVLHADDPPSRLAMGVAIAMFITFTPTVGIQMILVVFFAWLFRANKVVGLPIVWISNPATVLPIYYMCYRLGNAILGGERKNAQWWAELAQPQEGMLTSIKFYWGKFWDIAQPLWLGSLIIASLVGYVSYYVTYFAIYGYRMKRFGQMLPPSAARDAKHASRDAKHASSDGGDTPPT